MVLCDRVVLFHDSPPQGRGNAEIFEAGLGLYNNMIPLPHASRRLMLDNTIRVATLAKRFTAPHAWLWTTELALTGTEKNGITAPI